MASDSSVNATHTLERFFLQYRKLKRPIAVSFRKLVPLLINSDRATHLIHPYPAKLLMHIPHFFLSNSILSKRGDVVLDPFSGSGTVLLEALLSGRNAIGADANPIARLISKVKTTLIDLNQLHISSKRLLQRLPSKSNIEQPDVVNLDHWFYPHVTKQLLLLLEAINNTRNNDVRDFFQICFSSSLRKVSLADPRLSVPVRLRYGQYPEGHWLREKMDDHLYNLRRVNAIDKFKQTIDTNYKRFVALKNLLSTEVEAKVICSDARCLKYDFVQNGSGKQKLADESVDLIITSPPYVGAQKYIRASSLSLGWLGLCQTNELRRLEDVNIGREHYAKSAYSEPMYTGISAADKLLKEVRRINPLRAHIAGTYLLEMREAIREMARVIKPGSCVILVAANNEVCGLEFKTTKYLTNIAEEFGLSLCLRLIDEIRSRGLMTKRNKTASVITREWVLVFQKGAN